MGHYGRDGKAVSNGILAIIYAFTLNLVTFSGSC
jgi:hypothetical protein